jgi:hypothetical protein
MSPELFWWKIPKLSPQQVIPVKLFLISKPEWPGVSLHHHHPPPPFPQFSA